MHANEQLFPGRGVFHCKGFLDDGAGIVKLAGMKNLFKLAALLVLGGMLGSCGIPMSAVRTVQNTARSAITTIQNPLGE